MSTFRADLRAHLLADAALAVTVGSRCYTFPVPANATRPYLVLRRVGSQIGGVLPGPGTTFAEDWEIQSWADTAAAADALSGEVIDAMNHIGHTDFGNRTVHVSYHVDTTDLEELRQSGATELPIYGRVDLFHLVRNSAESGD